MKNLSRYKCNKFEEDADLFFTSDQHFFHKNIIKLANRPFENVEEMNSTMIGNWNNVVSKDSTIFILGDFCFGSRNMWADLLPRLNGSKILILGNHDYNNFSESLEKFFITVRDRMEIKVGEQKLVMDHYPSVTWSGINKGSWQLYGHIHERDFEPAKPSQYNVGVERNNYTPLSFKELSNIINYQINNNTINLTKKEYGLLH